MRFSSALFVALVAQLAGCKLLNPVPEPESTFPDQYINELAGTVDSKNSSTQNLYISKEASFRSLALEASKPNASADTINLYLKTGFSLANMYCALYFERLTRDQALVQYQKAQMNLAGGLATALMGIFSAGSAATGATGAAFGFFGASLDNINTSFLLAPNVENVQKLVIDAHISIVKNLPSDGFNNFPDAQTLLIRYVSLCTFGGIKSLIDQSVKAAQPVANSSGAVSIAAPAVVAASEVKTTR